MCTRVLFDFHLLTCVLSDVFRGLSPACAACDTRVRFRRLVPTSGTRVRSFFRSDHALAPE